MTKFIIIYDIPREKKILQVKVNRFLKAINANKLQHSIWEATDLRMLKKVASLIRKEGGESKILAKKIVY